MVYTSLARLGFPQVPAAVRETLKERFARAALSNQLLARETVRLLKLIAGIGIDAIPLKGVALGSWL